MGRVQNYRLVRPEVDVAPHGRTRETIGAPILSARPPKIHSIELSLIAEFVIDAYERLIVFISPRTGGGEVIEFTSARIIREREKAQNFQTNRTYTIRRNHVQLTIERKSGASSAGTVGIPRGAS